MRLPQADVLSRAARILFFIDAVVWVAFGIAILTRLPMWSETQSVVMVVVAGLMLGNAAALFLAGLMVGARPPRYVRLTALLAALNAVTSVMDQIGLLDLLSLAYSLILLAICLRLSALTRTRTTAPRRSTSPS
jgi:hypothetical protein